MEHKKKGLAMLVMNWRRAAVLVLGLILFLSPWIFGFTDLVAARRNAWICGVAIGLASIAEMVAAAQWEAWIRLLLGLWVTISPWLDGLYSSMHWATNVYFAVGLAVAVLALSEWWMPRKPPHVTT
jgi:hypothetical protein